MFEHTGWFKGYKVNCTYCGKPLIRNVKTNIFTCYKCRKKNQKEYNKSRYLKKKEAKDEMAQTVL